MIGEDEVDKSSPNQTDKPIRKNKLFVWTANWHGGKGVYTGAISLDGVGMGENGENQSHVRRTMGLLAVAIVLSESSKL